MPQLPSNEIPRNTRSSGDCFRLPTMGWRAPMPRGIAMEAFHGAWPRIEAAARACADAIKESYLRGYLARLKILARLAAYLALQGFATILIFTAQGEERIGEWIRRSSERLR